MAGNQQQLHHVEVLRPKGTGQCVGDLGMASGVTSGPGSVVEGARVRRATTNMLDALRIFLQVMSLGAAGDARSVRSSGTVDL